MAKIKEVSRSNLVRRLPIGRLREKRRMGGGAARRSSSSRGGASPELVKIGRPGGTSSGAWPGMIYEPRVIHLSAKIGEPELGMACASATAALRWRETTASIILLGSGAMV